MRSRIMYVEDKSGGLIGPARIGRVQFSKTGATLHYAGRSFQSLKGVGFKANYFDIDTGDQFWISGPRRDGADGLDGRITQPKDVDADVADAYWRDVRGFRTAPLGKALGSAGVEPKKTQIDSASLNERRGRKTSRVVRALRRRAAETAKPSP